MPVRPSFKPWTFGFWRVRIPGKIKIFLWQQVRDHLPSGVEVQKCHGPRDGLCPLCGAVEHSNHILFSCIMAQFMWVCFHDVTGCSWARASFSDWYCIMSRLSGQTRRMAWFCFATMAWELWHIRNKALIEGIFIKHPADAICKMTIFMQPWRTLSRSSDMSTIDFFTAQLHRYVHILRKEEGRTAV